MPTGGLCGCTLYRRSSFTPDERREHFGESKRISRRRKEVGNDINPYFWKRPLQKQSLSNEQKF
jgi:hypothetical protein